MEEKKSTSRQSPRLEVIVAITLGLLAIACFVVQALTQSSTTTSKETILFNLLQFLLTIGFTWFSTRAISRNEFEQSLKRFAISAYRRISDIERLVIRLQSEVKSMITDNPDKENHDLYIVEAIVADTCQVVRSSIADWADVIGEELIAIEKIKRLEQEKVELNNDSSIVSDRSESETLKEINKQIAELKATLPARLQFAARVEEGLSRKDLHAARWLANQHKKDKGLKLRVVTGDGYEHDREYSSLKVGEGLYTVKLEDRRVDIADNSGAILGRLQNTSPLGYDEFVQALENCYGTSSIPLEFVEHLGSERRGGEMYAWFTVRVLQEPTIEAREKRSSNTAPNHQQN